MRSVRSFALCLRWRRHHFYYTVLQRLQCLLFPAAGGAAFVPADKFVLLHGCCVYASKCAFKVFYEAFRLRQCVFGRCVLRTPAAPLVRYG